MLSINKTNELTNKIVHSDISHDLCTLITGCGYTNCSTDTALERDNKIIYSCHKSIKEIKKLKINRQTCLDGYTKAIEYLLGHNTRDNRKLLQYMLSSKNNIRGRG